MILKTAGIPMWVTIFALITFVFGSVLGLKAIFGPMLGQGIPGFGESVDPALSASWGGRALGLGLAALVAVFLKSPNAYIVAFVGGVGHDVGHIIGEVSKSETSI